MKTLLLDIETAPNKVYTWGLWKQNVALNQIDEPGYTLCWAAKWLGEKGTMFSSIHHDGKKAMLLRIYELLDEADVVIHYNGTNFDLPILSQEFLSIRWPPPSPVQQIDLLRTARQRFRLVSNKLDYVLTFLGLENKVEHKGMALWRGCMDGDKKSWKVMEKYNKKDVTQLEKVYDILRPWVRNHPNHALYTDDVQKVCPSCGSSHLQKRGTYRTAVFTYQRYQCQAEGCGAWSKDRFNDMDKEKRESVLKGI